MNNLDKQFEKDLEYLKDRSRKFKLYRNIITSIAVIGGVITMFCLLG